jgi:hypothetical protein
MEADEMDYPMMGTPEMVVREDRVGLRSKVAIGKEQQLDPLPHLILGLQERTDERFYVSHVDLSRNPGYR